MSTLEKYVCPILFARNIYVEIHINISPCMCAFVIWGNVVSPMFLLYTAVLCGKMYCLRGENATIVTNSFVKALIMVVWGFNNLSILLCAPCLPTSILPL